VDNEVVNIDAVRVSGCPTTQDGAIS